MNKSYRRYAVCRTTTVVAYVRQTIVNSHPDPSVPVIGPRLSRSLSPLTPLPRTWACPVENICPVSSVSPPSLRPLCLAASLVSTRTGECASPAHAVSVFMSMTPLVSISGLSRLSVSMASLVFMSAKTSISPLLLSAAFDVYVACLSGSTITVSYETFRLSHRLSA